jgi:hypothetical protein
MRFWIVVTILLVPVAVVLHQVALSPLSARCSARPRG